MLIWLSDISPMLSWNQIQIGICLGRKASEFVFLCIIIISSQSSCNLWQSRQSSSIEITLLFVYISKVIDHQESLLLIWDVVNCFERVPLEEVLWHQAEALEVKVSGSQQALLSTCKLELIQFAYLLFVNSVSFHKHRVFTLRIGNSCWDTLIILCLSRPCQLHNNTSFSSVKA